MCIEREMAKSGKGFSAWVRRRGLLGNSIAAFACFRQYRRCDPACGRIIHIYQELFIGLPAKYGAPGASFIKKKKKTAGMLLMRAVAFAILPLPMLHDITGIAGLFFPQIIRAALSVLRG